MAKRTVVSLPGTKPKPKPKSKPETVSAKKPLSREIITDSSDESAAEEKQKSPMKIGVHKPNGTAKKPSQPIPKATVEPKKTVHANEELESESSDSDVSDNESVRSKEYPGRSGGESPESEGSRSGSESSDESDEEQAPAQNARTQSPQSKPSQSHTIEFRPAQPFVPPKGFTAAPTSSNASSQTTKMFSNLEGKQLWHITAPAGISLSDLKQVAMDKVLKGEPILTQKGVDYGFSTSEKSENAAQQVLIPQSNGYKAAPGRISQTLHLQQVIRLPRLSLKQADQNTGSEAAASITRSTIRAPRPQVKGLKMRYFHSGFGDQEPGTIGSSDSEDETPSATAGLALPRGIQLPMRPEKRKHEGSNGVEASEAPSKKHKKQRTEEEIKKKEAKKAKKERKKEKERTKSKS